MRSNRIKQMIKSLEDITVDERDDNTQVRQITEGDRNEEPVVVVSGPLSEVYTEALAEAYPAGNRQTVDEINSREADSDPNRQARRVLAESLESAANDVMASVNAVIVQDENATEVENPETVIYGVSGDSVNEDTVVEVATQMSQFDIDRPEEYIVVVDATNMAENADAGVEPRGDTEQRTPLEIDTTPMTAVLETMVARMGGKVVYSLKEAIESIRI